MLTVHWADWETPRGQCPSLQSKAWSSARTSCVGHRQWVQLWGFQQAQGNFLCLWVQSLGCTGGAGAGWQEVHVGGQLWGTGCRVWGTGCRVERAGFGEQGAEISEHNVC